MTDNKYTEDINTGNKTMTDELKKAREIAEKYKGEFVKANIALRYGDSTEENALFEKIYEAEGAELWEVIEAQHMVFDAAGLEVAVFADKKPVVKKQELNKYGIPKRGSYYSDAEIRRMNWYEDRLLARNEDF